MKTENSTKIKIRDTNMIHRDRQFWANELKKNWNSYDLVAKLGIKEQIEKLNEEYKQTAEKEIQEIRDRISK